MIFVQCPKSSFSKFCCHWIPKFSCSYGLNFRNPELRTFRGSICGCRNLRIFDRNRTFSVRKRFIFFLSCPKKSFSLLFFVFHINWHLTEIEGRCGNIRLWRWRSKSKSSCKNKNKNNYIWMKKKMLLFLGSTEGDKLLWASILKEQTLEV